MLLTQIFPGYHETIYQKVTGGLVEMNTRIQAQKNVTERNYRFTLMTGNIRIFRIYKYQNFIFSY